MIEKPNGDLQWIPPKYDPARDRPADDRDSNAPAFLAGLMNDMDELCVKWRAASGVANAAYLSTIGDDMAAKWEAIRRAQGL